MNAPAPGKWGRAEELAQDARLCARGTVGYHVSHPLLGFAARVHSCVDFETHAVL